MRSPLTLRDPILTEQEPVFWDRGGAELEQTVDESQSPQEQPSDVSLHEYVVTFISFIPDDSSTPDLKSIAYGEPGRLGSARFPIKAYHSDKRIYQLAQVR